GGNRGAGVRPVRPFEQHAGHRRRDVPPARGVAAARCRGRGGGRGVVPAQRRGRGGARGRRGGEGSVVPAQRRGRGGARGGGGGGRDAAPFGGERAANASAPNGTGSLELAPAPAQARGTACRPTFAELRAACHRLPRGQGAVAFPAPWLGWVPCDPDLSCREGTLRFAKELLAAGLLVLALLPFLWCALRAQLRREEKRIFGASGDEANEPPGCCSCWPTRGSSAANSSAQSPSRGSSTSSGASAPPATQARGPTFGTARKSTGGLFAKSTGGPAFGAGGGGPRSSASTGPSWGQRRQRP
ncbi:unnamed protein product, partial [Prorocentrum cordatum]